MRRKDILDILGGQNSFPLKLHIIQYVGRLEIITIVMLACTNSEVLVLVFYQYM